jgi:hypothetical protein
VGEYDRDKEAEDEGVEAGHDDEAEDAADDAEEFDAVVAGDAGSEVVGDLAVKDHDAAASDQDSESDEEGAGGESIFHKLIVAQVT